ncbi:MAG: signal peptidase II [Alphaproteobacteria bacterium]|nr:signal peptidase II [Alphaproteobacteria bacterium]
MRHRRATIGFYMMAVVGLTDQIAKWLILDRLGDVEHMAYVAPFLNFVLVWNKGVTFGILSHVTGQHYMPYALIGVAAVILFFLGRWLWLTNSTLVALALGAIMGGAVGNVIDRVRYGAVVDFLDFHYRGYHWYAFNIADAAIVTGVALLLLDGMLKGK